jgi:hypothetical protein
MINDDANQPKPQAYSLEKRLSQVLDVVSDLIHHQKDLASINRQLQWDLREAELRIKTLEAWRIAYRNKHPNE